MARLPPLTPAGRRRHAPSRKGHIIFAYILAQKLKLPTKHTVILLLAGTIPVMTFFVERWMMRTYIAPALAVEDAAAGAAQQPVGR